MHFYSYALDVESDGSGDASVETIETNGELVSIQYTKNDTDPYADTVDFSITNTDTGEIIWAEENVTATKIVYPEHPTNRPDGTQNAHGSNATGIYERFSICNSTLTITISNAGDTKTGKFTIIYKK
jgi:hypothetical protein